MSADAMAELRRRRSPERHANYRHQDIDWLATFIGFPSTEPELMEALALAQYLYDTTQTRRAAQLYWRIRDTLDPPAPPRP
jgi:hypothetical protein